MLFKILLIIASNYTFAGGYGIFLYKVRHFEYNIIIYFV